MSLKQLQEKPPGSFPIRESSGGRQADELTQFEAIALRVTDLSQAHWYTTACLSNLSNRATGCLKFLDRRIQIIHLEIEPCMWERTFLSFLVEDVQGHDEVPHFKVVHPGERVSAAKPKVSL